MARCLEENLFTRVIRMTKTAENSLKGWQIEVRRQEIIHLINLFFDPVVIQLVQNSDSSDADATIDELNEIHYVLRRFEGI